ncbi:unnamed protein product [Rhizophagus irregularis]|uniref:Serine-threonine/tyrosine-protein kinase catalytic domain-containing protein n=1 Tax=Rhizophagus irregularis TaxID=588596 RepID=A0A915ZHT9_9GLOM|nr:unnamed protein product [Rhizophagus irregularis]
MWEVVTCVPPYKDESYLGDELRFQIRKGRRPEIDDEFPECYAQLMKQCWSANPDERPKAEELYKKIYEFQIGYAGYDFIENYNPIYKDIFTKAQVKRKKFLEAVYKVENNIDLIEDEKKDLDDRDDKNLNKRVDRYFFPPHPEAYTKSRLLSNLNNYRQPKVKEEISEVTRTLEFLTVNNFNSGIIDISFDDE